MRVMIACGGLGTRLLPMTLSVPKALLPVGGVPLLHFCLRECLESGLPEVGILCRSDQEAIVRYFASPSNALRHLRHRISAGAAEAIDEIERIKPIFFASSSESLGLGGQLLELKSEIGNEPFLLLFPDEICLPSAAVIVELRLAYAQRKSTIVAAVSKPATSKTWIIDRIQAPSAAGSTRLIGRYLCTQDLFVALSLLRAEHPNEAIGLMDALAVLSEYSALTAVRFEGRWHDCGNVQGYVSASASIAV